MRPDFKTAKDFMPDLTKRETILGWIYLPIHVFVLPVLMNLMPLFWPWPLPSLPVINVWYLGIGLVFTAVFFRKLLRREFDRLCDHIGESLMAFIMAYFVWYILSVLVQLLLTAGGVTIPENPNDASIMALAGQDRGAVMVVAVFMAPVLEEVLFRGVVFQSIRKKHRVLAYGVSMTLFALMHIWGYAVILRDATVLLYALEYLPITLALTWSYERSGTLWVAIFFHMFNNLLPFLIPAAA